MDFSIFILEHFCVKCGNLAASTFEISYEKNRHTDAAENFTNATAVGADKKVTIKCMNSVHFVVCFMLR